MLQLRKGICLESLQQPFKRALLTASQIGADAVEINARTQLRPTELSHTGLRHFKKMLDDLQLKVCSVHFPTRRGFGEPRDLERRLDAVHKTLSMAYGLGCRVVRSPIGHLAPEPESDSWQTMLQALTDLGVYSQRCGAWLAIQTGFDDGAKLKALIDSLPPASVGVDFDPAEFLINGFSTEQAMRLLGAHVMSFRARDAVRDLSQGRGLEVQLGRGSVDLATLFGILEEHRYDGYIIVERNSNSDSVQQCAQAIEYLANLFS
jgi:sugar phosphate isomerase/epimerase